MTGRQRCDEILRVVDEAVGDPPLAHDPAACLPGPTARITSHVR
jgi:hypothetical protein